MKNILITSMVMLFFATAGAQDSVKVISIIEQLNKEMEDAFNKNDMQKVKLNRFSRNTIPAIHLNINSWMLNLNRSSGVK